MNMATINTEFPISGGFAIPGAVRFHKVNSAPTLLFSFTATVQTTST